MIDYLDINEAGYLTMICNIKKKLKNKQINN